MELEQAALPEAGLSAAVVPEEVLVRFTTGIVALRVPTVPISVPTSLTRAGLSKVIQHLLGKGDDEPLPALEFFVPPGSAPGVSTRTLLRSTLGKHLAALKVSFESTVTLEYAIPLPPPTAGPSTAQEDWVGAVDGSESLLVSGSFDGSITVRLAADAGATAAAADGASGSASAAATSVPAAAPVTTIAHAGAVSALHVLELTPADSAASSSLSAVVASGGHDATVRLWRVRAASAAASAAAGAAPTKRSLAVQQYAELNGARAPLRAARIDPSGRFIAGGDSGGNVFVWSAEAPAAEPSRDSAAAAGAGAAGPRSSKRARTRGASEASDAGAHGAGAAVAAPSSSSAASASAITVVTRDPAVVLLAAHRGAATGVAWLSSASFATCGLDGAIRIWELQEGEAGEDGASSAAAGSAGLTCVPTTTLSSGKAALAITASPLGALLATAHADGCVRVWDSRGRAAEGSAAEAGDEAVTVRADGLRAVLPVHATTLKASAAGGYAVTSAAGGSGKKVAPAAATDAPGSGAHDADSTWVSSVSWCPSSGHHVAAGSFSGAVSVWDTRSPSAPLFTLQPHAAPASALAGKGAGAAASGPVPAKALCVAWAGAVEEAAAAAGSGASAAVDTVSGAKQLVVSGGSDKQVRCSVFPAVLK